jgi:DNA repair exonuclease SbcCD ATPase subunit
MGTTVSGYPDEARRLLAAAPDEFVAERRRLAGELRRSGRREDAEAVAALRKPPAVVLAVNRAARDRPEAARAAADAALRVLKAQAEGSVSEVAEARGDMDRALDLLAEVAVAHVRPDGSAPSETTRRRIQELLRRAVALDDTREALRRGALVEEQDAPGFASVAGVPVKPSRDSRARRGGTAKPNAAEERRRRREQQVRAELADAEEKLREAESRLREAEGRLREAERELGRAERAVAALREKLERPS